MSPMAEVITALEKLSPPRDLVDGLRAIEQAFQALRAAQPRSGVS